MSYDDFVQGISPTDSEHRASEGTVEILYLLDRLEEMVQRWLNMTKRVQKRSTLH